LQGHNSFNPNHPLNPTTPTLDSSPNNKNTILPLKLFQHPRENIQPFTKNFKFLSLSLPSQVSFSVLPKTPFSLSHPPTTLVRWQNAPLSGGEQPHLVGKLQAFRYSLILSLSLATSLFLSLHLIGSARPSTHVGTAVPLSLLHCLISVSLATTSHCPDSLPQIFSHKRILNGKEVRIVYDT
jgi:hypothetical protein